MCQDHFQAIPFSRGLLHGLGTLLVCVGIGISVLSIGISKSNAETSAKPNIVVILTDDQGYGDVGCFGAKSFKTPNLDRMASEGTRFTSFYVAQPVCTASRAALMTGSYSNRVSLFSAHQMGTARAGADASAHPCDPDGRVRTDTAGGILPGAYVGDASLFPTASGVNPMLTVMALAERTARAVLADRR